MADRVFTKSFSGAFTGINAESSALEGDANSVARAVNYEWALSNNLRGRVGSQLIHGNYFQNIYGHNYSRTTNQYTEKFQSSSPYTLGTLTSADGGTISQLLGIEKSLWRFDSYNISITRVSGSTTITSYATIGANGNVHFILTQGGATYLDYDCSTNTYYDLLVAIDATANFSVDFTRANCPPYALINGIQTPVDNGAFSDGAFPRGLSSRTITVTAGHTFVPGDYLVLPKGSQLAGEWIPGYVIATTATTITYLISASYFNPLLASGEVIGILSYYAQFYQIDISRSGTSLPFYFFRPVGNMLGQFANTKFYTSFSEFNLPNFTSFSDVCYLAAKTSASPGLPLFKYDGQTVSAAGLPKPTLSVVGAGGALTGTFSYRAFYRRRDAQGNIIEGTPSTAISVTLAAQNGSLTIGCLQYSSSYIVNSAYSSQAIAAFAGGATTLQVDNSVAGNPGYLQVGDPVCFNVAYTAPLTTPVGTLQRSIVTSVDGSPLYPAAAAAMTIRMEAVTAGNIADNTPLSSGLSIVILRTTNGGTIWYQVAEIANNAFAASMTLTDSTTDATLAAGIIFTDPTTGKEHDPVTDCSMVCEHQGGLATAGAFANPNSVNFSSADGPEYFPLASNSFEIPSTLSGKITAIASDTLDRLAVFKKDAYYDVAGDLDGGQFSINVVNEGDYGIVSHTSLVRVKGKLIGLSNLGFVTIYDGVLYDQDFRLINARIINQPWTLFLSSACNDKFNRNYICTIPVYGASTYSKTFVLDYSRGTIVPFERDYVYALQPIAVCMYGTSLCTIAGTTGVTRRLYRFNGDSPTGNDSDSYIDHTSAIPYILETQAMNLGETSIFKSPIRLRVYSIPNDYIVEGWIPFAIQVDTSIFPDPSYFGSANPGGVTSTLTFSGINNWYQDLKLSGAKSLVIMVRFTTNTIRTMPFLTGYEIVTTTPYTKEDLSK